MEKSLERFSVFILNHSPKDDALSFCKELGIETGNVAVFDKPTIENIRTIKKLSSLSFEHKRAFLLKDVGIIQQNALLKLLEEPYPFVYFIFYGEGELLDTIKSRAYLINKKVNYAEDEKLLKAVIEKNISELLLIAYSMQTLEKQKNINSLEYVARELSLLGESKKTEIINRELVRFKKFNLNQKLFLFALFSKLFGGVEE